MNTIPENFIIKYGSHSAPDGSLDASHGACVMELVSYLANEPWSDHPECACPVITEFAIRINDRIPTDAMRTEILDEALVRGIIGTRSTRAIQAKRAFLLADFAVRIAAPFALDAVGKKDEAEKLRALDPVVDIASAQRALTAAATAAADSRPIFKSAAECIRAMCALKE